METMNKKELIEYINYIISLYTTIGDDENRKHLLNDILRSYTKKLKFMKKEDD